MDPTAACTNATPEHVPGHVLRPDEFFARTTYLFAEPAPALRRWVERYWSVQWALAPGESFATATLDDPSINLTLERGHVRRAGTSGAGQWITGPVAAGRFDVSLAGSGSVVGVKFAVGGTAAFLDADLPALRDRTVPASDWFAEPLPADLPPDAVVAAPRLDAWLAALTPAEPVGFADFRALLGLLDDPAITTLDALADRSGVGVRTLQRTFRRFTGMGPKRLLVRARVMDAVAALDRHEDVALADLAQRLGWFDQPHFTRDFRRITGVTPASYAQRRSPASRAAAS